MESDKSMPISYLKGCMLKCNVCNYTFININQLVYHDKQVKSHTRVVIKYNL